MNGARSLLQEPACWRWLTDFRQQAGACGTPVRQQAGSHRACVKPSAIACRNFSRSKLDAAPRENSPVLRPDRSGFSFCLARSSRRARRLGRGVAAGIATRLDGSRSPTAAQRSRPRARPTGASVAHLIAGLEPHATAAAPNLNKHRMTGFDS